MKRNLKLFYIYCLSFLYVFFGCLLFTSTAFAQIFLEEGKIFRNVDKGDLINESMVVQNTSDESIDVLVYWEDFEYQPPYEGSKKFFPAGTTNNSANSWISYSPQKFTLAPHGKQKISYVIDVPPNAKGGYY